MQKADFKNYRALCLEIRKLKAQLMSLEASLYGPRGQEYSLTPKGGGQGDGMLAVISRHIELEKHYQETLAAKEAQQLAIERAIDSLDDPAERVVMRLRYIEGRDWKYIIAELAIVGYSEREVYRRHGFALLKLKEV